MLYIDFLIRLYIVLIISTFHQRCFEYEYTHKRTHTHAEEIPLSQTSKGSERVYSTTKEELSNLSQIHDSVYAEIPS